MIVGITLAEASAVATILHSVFKTTNPDITDCNLKKDYQILILFRTNIPDKTGHQTTVQFPTSLNGCVCTTLETEEAKYALK